MKRVVLTLACLALLNFPFDARSQETGTGISSSQLTVVAAHSLSLGPAFRYAFRTRTSGPFLDSELEIGLFFGPELRAWPLTLRSGIHWGWQFETGLFTALGVTNWFVENFEACCFSEAFAAGVPLPTGQIGWLFSRGDEADIVIGVRVELVFVGLTLKVLN